MPDKYVYTTAPGTLRAFLKGIPDRAIPPKVTRQYLRTIGMKSTNDRSIISVLKFVKLLDGSGSPTDEYRQFKNKMKGGTVLASLIRGAYDDLYSTFDDAHNQSDEVLLNFFRENTKLGTNVVKLQAATFKVLCEFASFTGTMTAEAKAKPQAGLESAALSSSYPSIHITLQIHLPESKDPTVYESIFQALSKHLLKGS